MKRVFIIHGWEATPDMHWFPWLKQELEGAGFEVQVPAMPDTDRPMLERWLERMALVVGEVDEETYFIGHSIGGTAVLKFLESLPHGQRAGGACIVASNLDISSESALVSFFISDLKYEKIRKSARAYSAVYSENDPDIDLENGYKLRNELAAELLIVPLGGHFCTEDGFTALPAVRDQMLKMAQ